jgi:hypothetical protein
VTAVTVGVEASGQVIVEAREPAGGVGGGEAGEGEGFVVRLQGEADVDGGQGGGGVVGLDLEIGQETGGGHDPVFDVAGQAVTFGPGAAVGEGWPRTRLTARVSRSMRSGSVVLTADAWAVRAWNSTQSLR